MGTDTRSAPPLHALGELIERVRHERGMSLRAVARAAGLSPNTVAELVAGDRLDPEPRYTTLDAIAAALEVPPEDLHFAARSALAGKEVRVYRVRVGGREMEVRTNLFPGEQDLTEAEIEQYVAAFRDSLSSGGS